jgi:hypothetical protein
MCARRYPNASALMTALETYVAPIWASRSVAESPSEIDHNGTITFVDLGLRKVGVTAHHVIARYRKELALFPAAGLAINLGNGATPFLSHVHVIDEDPSRDIAVISIPEISRWQRHHKSYFRYRYPAVSPQRGDAMTVVGYPGALRRAGDTFGSFTPHGIGMTVSNVPGMNVMLVDTSRTLRTTIEQTGEIVPHINPGGMSGSAGFFFRDGELRLGGFVYEGSPEMLFLVPATLMEPDGRLDR